MKSKHYDSTLKKWVTHGASNASELELTNPGFLDEKGNSVSINNGFTKMSNRMSKLEQNLAWIYLNGAKGGGGGGGGGGDSDTGFTIEILDENGKDITGSSIPITSNSITLRIYIGNTKYSKPMTVDVKNAKTNKLLASDKLLSMRLNQTITVNNINDTTTLAIQAYDSNLISTNLVFITIITGSLKMSVSGKLPNSVIYTQSLTQTIVNTELINNIKDSEATIFVEVNKKIYSLEKTNLNVTLSSFNIRKIISDLLNQNEETKGSTEQLLFPGYNYTFKIYAKTKLNDLDIVTDPIEFFISVLNSDQLALIVKNFSLDKNNPTPISLGNSLIALINISYGGSYKIFNIESSVFLCVGEECKLLEKNILQETKSTNTLLLSLGSTTNIKETDLSKGEYCKISLFGYAANAPEDKKALDKIDLYFYVTKPKYKVLQPFNYKGTLLACFNSFSNVPANNIWKYTWGTNKNDWNFYLGPFKDIIIENLPPTLEAFKVNNKDTGFIQTGIPRIRLEGSSYVKLNCKNWLFTDTYTNIYNGTNGFNLSITFNADINNTATKGKIISIGEYKNGNLLDGFEINTSEIKCIIKNKLQMIIPITLEEIMTVDLNVELTKIYDKKTYEETTGYYYKIYLNGILTSVVLTTKDSSLDLGDWTFNKDLYLGCLEENGKLDLFGTCTIYDFKIYSSPVEEVGIVLNYISSQVLAKKKFNELNKTYEIDTTLDQSLRLKNFFTDDGTNLFYEEINGLLQLKDDIALFASLQNGIMQGTIPYPIVEVSEISNSVDNLFEPYALAIWSEGDKDMILKKAFPITMKYISKDGDVTINSDLIEAPSISIQGTSSLTYNSKNFEIRMGKYQTESGLQKEVLFTPTLDWLPENEFTLKADVMDSAHVNNVVIGKVINGTLNNKSSSLLNFPDIGISNDVWGGEDRTNFYTSKLKHTSEGFPVLLFIRFKQFNLESNQIEDKPIKFMGIYNFNLGRYAYYNLGLKLLKDYKITTVTGLSISFLDDGGLRTNPDLFKPSVVKDYEPFILNPNVYSMEVNHNESKYGVGDLATPNIVKNMLDEIYSSSGPGDGYTEILKLYELLAQMVTAGTIPQYDFKNNLYTLIENKYWPTELSKNTFEVLKNLLNWNNTCAYYILALTFGMVDSMCKNLTYRHWRNGIWYTCFYDMDTAFGLDNAGNEAVSYYAHLHYYYNKTDSKYNLTSKAEYKNFETGNSELTKELGFSPSLNFNSYYNRLWDIVERFSNEKIDDISNMYYIYEKLRTTIIKNPKEFIKNHYIKYTDLLGAVVFNIDYKIKYLLESKIWDNITKKYYTYTNTDLLRFLHGNRALLVSEWFTKRIYFLDGIYIKKDKKEEEENSNLINIPILKTWESNKAKPSQESFSIIEMAASSKILHKWKHTVPSEGVEVWLDEIPKKIIVKLLTGDNIVSLSANLFITQYKPFNTYAWYTLSNIDLPLLNEIDLSNLLNFESLPVDWGGSNGNNGLVNVETMILKNVKYASSIKDTNNTLNVKTCYKLKTLDISGSCFTNIEFPVNSALQNLDISNTNVAEIKLKDLSSLKNFNCNNCNNATTFTMNNCASIEYITIPKNIVEVNISNCENLQNINFEKDYRKSNLQKVDILNCKNLRNLNLLGLDNFNLSVFVIGCENLETINFSNSTIDSDNLILPEHFNLKSLDISNTTINKLNYGLNYVGENGTIDLSAFPDLTNINTNNCNNINKIICCDNPDNPIELNSGSFENCRLLQTLEGNFIILGYNVFNGCSNLKFELKENTKFKLSISDNVTILINTFKGCNLLTYDDFKIILNMIPKKALSINGIFLNCYGINGTVFLNMFKNCTSIEEMNYAFAGTRLTGYLPSRSNYSDDELTWGIFDYTPNLKSLEGTFQNTDIEGLDSRLFEPIIDSLNNIDSCFENCLKLKSVKDTRVKNITSGNFESKDFFLKLTNLKNPLGWPKYVFKGCQNINMNISKSEDNKTLLFHTLLKPVKVVELDDSLYSGINLIGNIDKDVFGDSKTLTIGKYYIPEFKSITGPFAGSGNDQLTIDLTNMGGMFSNQSKLITLSRVFAGLKLINDLEGEYIKDTIPNDLLKGCFELRNISGLFSRDSFIITNHNHIYEFPNSELFKDCTNLLNISGLFKGQNLLKIKLIPLGFVNCKLQNVSEVFSNTGLFGIIPYKFWYMYDTETQTINKTIKVMSNTFYGCHCLGFTEDRTIDTTTVLANESTLKWEDGIPVVGKEGSEIIYSHIIEGDDLWGMDGTIQENEFYKNYTNSEISYYSDDNALATSISKDISNLNWVEKGYQNYIIPCDYFRYCNPQCNLTNALVDLNRITPEIIRDDSDLIIDIKRNLSSNKFEGLKGRMPCKLFEEFTEIKNIEKVFGTTHFSAYINTYREGSINYPGLYFPKDLFIYNTKLESVSGLFSNFNFSIGCMINKDLFKNNIELKNISGLFSNCMFYNNEYGLDKHEEGKFSLIYFDMFISNNNINNASSLFSCSGISNRGLLIILNIINENGESKFLLLDAKYITDISGMFSNCSRLKGTVPIFLTEQYPELTSYFNYLYGVNKNNIENAASIPPYLQPEEWLEKSLI